MRRWFAASSAAIGINAMDFPAVAPVIVDGTNGDAAATFDGFGAGVVDG